MTNLHESLSAGYGCLSAWAGLIDRINVFPVADGDTGTNLRISLAPLRNPADTGSSLKSRLALSATGNSGNIGAAFFQEFCQAQLFNDLAKYSASGREKAWLAIGDPCEGTMLSVFDSLASTLASGHGLDSVYEPLSSALQKAVLDTTRLLPDCRKAGVVDSGALAMYVFFDGFFSHLTARSSAQTSIVDIFTGRLAISSDFKPKTTDSHCIDAVVQKGNEREIDRADLVQLGESVVVVEDDSSFKVHIHTADPAQLHNHLGSFGEVVHWSDEKIVQDVADFGPGKENNSVIHIITDAAGSLPKELAHRYGISLLDSYIVTDDSSRPESLCNPELIYSKLRQGKRVTTAQASTFERQQYYKSICEQHGPSLYLCVGSAFTGNYDTAIGWKSANDKSGQLTVIDTGAASGRLALIALLTARYACTGTGPEEVITFAETTISNCEEYVFIDELKYLVAGGRLTKSSGFFGDLLHMKPVITPTSDGAKKVGVVHTRKGQLDFALEKLKSRFTETAQLIVMLQYSDNEQWVRTTALENVRTALPQAEIMLTPLSLTSGVHMGPGTWSIAFAPSSTDESKAD
jgi:uncharacterized protein